MTTPRRIRVAVIFGGRSPEHGVSAVSAGSVIGALDPGEFEVVPVGITRDGQWVLTDGAGLAIESRSMPEITSGSGTAVVLPGDPTTHGLVVVDPAEGVRALGDVDVVFPVLHGAFGEDGTIQGLFEMAGIPYVGSGRVRLGGRDGQGVHQEAGGRRRHPDRRRMWCCGPGSRCPPPIRSGSACRCSSNRRGAVRRSASPRSATGPTWTPPSPTARAGRPEGAGRGRASSAARSSAACWRGSTAAHPRPACSPRSPSSGHEFYDFEAKYLDDSCVYDIPARLPDAGHRQDPRVRLPRPSPRSTAPAWPGWTSSSRRSSTSTSTRSTRCPGFTSTSMFPRMWAATGLDYPKLVNRLIRRARRAPACTESRAPGGVRHAVPAH